ncbi:MAG TPA: site-specific integrase [Hanamia sp.]|nr:site-specific integrase [Hanamia sp.]
MEKSFGLFFHLKKNRDFIEGELPVYMRITVDGIFTEISTKRKCDSNNWNVTAGRMSGKSESAKTFNAYLDTLQQKVFEAKRKLIETDKELTAESIKNLLLGKDTRKKYMVLEVFQYHNDQMAALVNQEYAPGTLDRYKTSYKHTQSFLKWKYKVPDVDIDKLNYEFITEYEFWLKSVRNCGHNTTMKYLANFKKIVIRCLKNGWLQKDPFIGFNMAKREVERTALTEHELQLLSAKSFSAERLSIVKDIFLFSCYSGLAYADVQKLKRSEIGIGIDGEKWIFIRRQKTDSSSRIPLLPPALQILERYTEHPQCKFGDKVLPVLSNQKMNAYLKEIADVCGITKNLTYHIARHTFATTVTLGNGVPIETVSKMLGHRNLKTTQHYAKILDMKVSEDMKNLKNRLCNK